MPPKISGMNNYLLSRFLGIILSLYQIHICIISRVIHTVRLNGKQRYILHGSKMSLRRIIWKGMNSFIRNKKSEFENKWGGVTKPNETLFYIEDINVSV